jgi:uncharacterized protein (TIGR02996 family)
LSDLQLSEASEGVERAVREFRLDTFPWGQGPIPSMNDEEAFQAALDADPNDRTTRLVFADWLEERGDRRAEGYRAIARLPVCDCRDNLSHNGHFLWMKDSWGLEQDGFATLPAVWVDLLEPVMNLGLPRPRPLPG